MACLSKYFFSLGVHLLQQFTWILLLHSTPSHDLYLGIGLFCDLFSKSWWVGKRLTMISVVIVIENDSGRKNIYWCWHDLNELSFAKSFPALYSLLYQHTWTSTASTGNYLWTTKKCIMGRKYIIELPFWKRLCPNFYWEVSQKWYW